MAIDYRKLWPRLRRILQHTTIRFLLTVVVLLTIYHGFGYITGPSHLSEQLKIRLDENPERVNILVTSKFPSEEFHIGIYQNLGSLRGTEGRTAKLFNVKPRDVRTLSRFYWIDNLDLANEK